MFCLLQFSDCHMSSDVWRAMKTTVPYCYNFSSWVSNTSRTWSFSMWVCLNDFWNIPKFILFFFFWVLFQFYWVFWLFPVICFLVCVCVNKLMRRLMSKCNWYGTTRYLLINSMLVNIKPCSLLCLSLFSFLYAEKPLIDRSQEALLRCKLI